MKCKFVFVLVCITVVTLMAGCGGRTSTASTSSAAPAAQKYVLRIGTGTGGIHPQNVFMEAYKAALEEATGGRIEVQLYPAGQLGNMAELIQGLRDGTVDSICFPTTYFSTTFPGAAMVDLSFMFDSSEQLWRVLTESETKYEKLFIDNGVIPVAWLRAFERTLISSKKVESMADFRNLKVWCMPSVVIQEEVRLLGAVTSNLDVGELAPSLQNGTVDGAISDIALYAAQSLHLSAKYLLEAPNDPMIAVFAASSLWFNKLPPDLQKTVRDVARSVVKEVEYPYIDTMKANVFGKMTSEGAEIVTPSAAFMADMKAALLPQAEWFLNRFPDVKVKEIHDEFLELIAADRAKH